MPDTPVTFNELNTLSGINTTRTIQSQLDSKDTDSLTENYILVGSAGGLSEGVAMSGEATIVSSGAVTLDNDSVIAKVLTGYTSGAGTVTAADSLLEAIQKLNGNAADLTTTVTGISQTATGTLTQANITAMNGAAVELIAAPAAGLAIVIDEIELLHDYDTAAYTGGGDVSIQYGAAVAAITLIDETFVTGTSDASRVIRPTIYDLDSTTGTGTGFDIGAVAAQNISVTNASAAFADGNAANIIKWGIRYHVITLLT